MGLSVIGHLSAPSGGNRGFQDFETGSPLAALSYGIP